MESCNNLFSTFIGLVKSWIPRRSEPLSRYFWMPDHICKVCYECDSQFTIFNRRHHCRICGRIFCGKCTMNSVPVSSDDLRIGQDEAERIRACNFCFKQWEQEVAGINNRPGISSSILSSSASTTSLCSSNSSESVDSSMMTVGSRLYSTGPYQRPRYGSGASLSQVAQMYHCQDKQDKPVSRRNSIADVGDLSPNELGFCRYRSDDDEDEHDDSRSYTEMPHFQQSDSYYSKVEFDEGSHGYQS